MKYTEKDITFVNVKQPNTIIPNVIGRQGRLTIDGDNVSNIDYKKTLINAIDIDWNGAQLDNDQINTTADLLNYIKNKTSGSGGGSSQSNIPSYTTSCYRWYREGHIPQSIIAKPSGNWIDIFNPDANLSDRIYCIPEKYWSKNAPNRPQGDYILWQSQAEVRLINDVWTIESWSNPFQISGINGTPGEDLSNREFIYKLFTTKHDWSTDNSNLNPEVWPATDDSDYVGPLIDGVRAWKDNPEGVDDANRYEYESQRTFENGHWTKFCRPYLRSCFGRNGMDGDGVEYVYIRTEGNTQPTVSQNQGSTLQEQLNDEYLPYVDYVDGNSQTHHERCTDDPTGINSTYKYEWVLKRRKTSPDSVTGERQWQAYNGQMALWAKYSEDGDSVEVRNGQLYINRVPQNITVEEQGGGGIAVGNITQQDITNNTNNNNYILGRYNGQLYVWIDGNPGHWVSLGESNGSGAYGHIAYADSVTISQVDNKTVIAISGFTVDSGSTSKKWIGICIDDNESDPGSTLTKPYTNPPSPTDWSTAQTELSKYKWQYVAGKDGNGFEFIYCLTKSGVIPGIDESDGITEGTNGYTSGNKLNSEFYPKITVQNGVVSQQVSTSQPTLNDKYYWSDDPVGDVDSTYTTLWWANRKFVNEKWTNFRGPSKIDEWKPSEVKTDIVPYYKWSNTGTPGVPSQAQPGDSNWEPANNSGWSGSIYLANPDSTDSSYKFYSCSATVMNGVFQGWGAVSETTSPNVIQPDNGVSPYQLVCTPSTISFRAESTGDFLDKSHNINCSLLQGTTNITNPIPTGCNIYYRRLYTGTNQSWQNSSTLSTDINVLSSNGHPAYYAITISSDFANNATATGISKEVSGNGYLTGIEICLSSANSSGNVSASNILASVTVPITCDGQKGASGSSAGLNGTSTYIIKLYRKLSSSEISALTSGNNGLNDSHPNQTIYYDFTDNKIYSDSTNRNIVTQVSSYDSNSKYWYLNKDDAANFKGDLYVTVASAITTDTSTRVQIQSSQWATPVLYTDSLNTATIFLYKRSSTIPSNKPSGLFTYNFLNKEFKWVENSQQWNSWSTTIPNGTNPCYIIQATACSATNIDYIDESEFSDPVLYVKNGDPGQSITGPKGDTGKMFFSMGVWDENTKYVQDSLKIPMVFYDDGEWNEALGCNGSYYYLNPEYTNSSGIQGVNTNPTGSASKFDNNTKNIWIKATNYGLVMTQGIFAEFAKFGSAIMSGDYMFSTNGKFNGQDVVAGNKLGDKPCYLFFNNENKNYEVTETLTQTLTPDNGESNTKSYTYNGSKLYLKQITINLNSETTQCDITNILNNNIYSSTSGKTNGITTFTVGKWIETGYKIKFTSYQGSISNAFNLNLIVSGDFVPNWIVDLKSGEMIASQGNFKLNADGTVNAAKGNFIIDANGNVNINGTIKAKNLYREIYINNEEETYYYYCTKVPESSDTNPSWSDSDFDYIPFKYTQGEYYKYDEIDVYWKDKSYYDSNNNIKYLTECTGYADFIILPKTANDASQTQNDVYDIILPDPSDFPNKVIEINDYRYVQDPDHYHLPTTHAECVVPGKMKNRIDDGNTNNSITLVTGSPGDVQGEKHTLISYKISNNYYWIKLNYDS